MDKSEDIEHEVLAGLSADIETIRRDIENAVLTALRDPKSGMEEGDWERGFEWLVSRMFGEAERLGLVTRTPGQVG